MIDLTNEKIGRLTVLELTDQKKNGKKLWRCLCDCQLEKKEEDREFYYASTSDLRKKVGVKSCGCYNKERCLKYNESCRKHNKYDLNGEYGTGYSSNTNEKFYFDLEDYNLIKNDNWIIVRGYVIRSRDNMPMHRVVMGVENIPYNNLRVDHIKGQGTTADNRKENLRIASAVENAQNHTLSKNNTSGVSGVSWSKSHNAWLSRIGVNNKRIHLGYYDNFDEAVAARQRAEEEYFGEWSYEQSQAM